MILLIRVTDVEDNFLYGIAVPSAELEEGTLDGLGRQAVLTAAENIRQGIIEREILD
jgi:hypothetical protein